MNKLKKLWKSYRYKTFTTIVLSAVLSILGDKLNIEELCGIGAFLVMVLIIFTMISFFVGVKNLWIKDSLKIQAVVFGIFGTGFLGLLAYLLLFY